MKKTIKDFFKAGSIGLLFQSGAVVNFQPLTNTGSINLAGPLSAAFTSNSLPGFFNAVFTMAISLGAILAVLRLSYAGWLYMSSDAFGKKSQAKEVIFDAILGLLLLIGIWIILNQINPNLLNLNVLQTIQSAQNGGTTNGNSSTLVQQQAQLIQSGATP